MSDTGPRAPRGAGYRTGLAALMAVLVLGSLVALAVLLAQAEGDAREAAERRFSERAQISAALTQSVFGALGGASDRDLARRFDGAPGELAARLRRRLPESRALYLAVIGADGRTLATAGRAPRRLALAGAAPRRPALSNVVGAGRGRVVEYAIPFGRGPARRALVQGVPLPLMRSFLHDYLLRLHHVDRAGLAVTDRHGVVLTRTGRISPAPVPGSERLTTRAAVPGTPWTLSLEAPRARVLASVGELRWLAWLLLAALALAALAGVWLHRRVHASARRQREANVALHESREQIRNLVDALEEGVAVHHADGRTELLNASARELMDSEGAILTGLPPGWGLLDETGAPLAAADAPAKRALHSGSACSQLIAVERPDGVRRWLRVRARPLLRPGEQKPYAVVVSGSDVSEQREMELHLTDLAQREPLTALWNRRRFEEDLARQIARCRSHGERAALLVLDIDNFKQVNDTFGHLAGDDVLRALADSLRGRLRGGDGAARIGGDEFAVVLAGVDEAEARAVAREAASRLAAFVRDELDGGSQVSLSIGVAVLDGETEGVAEAFAAADRAMYADKRRTTRPPAEHERRDSDLVEAGPALAGDAPAPSLSSLQALVAAVQARDSYTAGHSRQVVTLARGVARRLQLDGAQTSEVEAAALLHDIGKIAVPDAILRKRGPLTDDEWVLMRQHPLVGAQMLASVPELGHLAAVIRAEHERWDGRGYPDGLTGRAIPLASRITFVCDAYHAMTSDRPYRRALSHQAAMAEIERESGRQFCPTAAGALLEVLEAQVAITSPVEAPEVAGAA